MNAELISVGTEILLGEIVNTDAQFLASELSAIGIDVYHQTVVGDNHKRLYDALCEAFKRADIVIASGGLGPTPDDITKEVIAKYMGSELVMHEESAERIKNYFRRVKRPMVEGNEKQAMLPTDGIVLTNNCGTAPGCIIEKNGKTAIMLPGPPNELTRMYTESVKPYLEKKAGQKLYTKTYHIFGMGESQVANIFHELMESGNNPSVAPYAKTGEVYLRLGVKADSEAEAGEKMSETEKLIKSKVGEYIYSSDGSSLNERAVQVLKEKGKTVSFAESCTGGMAAKMITDVSGASEVLAESYVTYANAAKEKILGVSSETLEQFGAVSEQTAEEMAKGVRRASGCDIGIGITGIAGPDGGTEDKPVGLVYVGVSTAAGTTVKELRLNGDRERVRYVTCLNVFDMIRRFCDEI